MTEIWAEWQNGQVECVDSAESESEAIYLVGEYQMAYGPAAKRIWVQEEGHGCDASGYDCREGEDGL